MTNDAVQKILYMVGSRHVTAAANAKINFGNGAVAHAVKARALEGDLRHHARAHFRMNVALMNQKISSPRSSCLLEVDEVLVF